MLSTAVRPVRFRDGPPVAGGARVLQLPNWASLDDRGRVRVIEQLIKRYGRDPRLRQVALDIVRAAGVAPRDYEGQARALLAWVNQNIYYVNEPGEQLQSVWYTMRTKSGDCDDCHILLSSLAESLRIPWRTVLSGRRRATGERVRWVTGQPFPSGVKFGHIYTMLGWPPFKPQRWAYADGSLRNAPLGWDIVAAKRLPPVPGAPRELMPELNGYGAIQIGSSSSTEKQIERKVEAAERQAFWKEIEWTKVASVALPTIISGLVLAYFANRRK